jgi:hypothetical protein
MFEIVRVRQVVDLGQERAEVPTMTDDAEK